MPGRSYNTSIRSLLASLASLDRDEGPVELRCMWFDDLYLPAGNNPEIFKPGVWDRGLQEWKAAFTEDELDILAEFHRVSLNWKAIASQRIGQIGTKTRSGWRLEMLRASRCRSWLN